MTSVSLFLIIIGYLAFLFGFAYLVSKKPNEKLAKHPLVYALTLGVYCTAWTYYGSIGVAATTGINFLAIYLGPVIAVPLWIVLMKKIITITKAHKVASIADFISLRYGNSRPLGAVITLTCLIATIPYIALQLKAISESFSILSTHDLTIKSSIYNDSTLYIAILIAVFVSFFGTRSTDASRANSGLMQTIALESILKLVFFILIGVVVVFYYNDGFKSLYAKASQLPNFESISTLGGLSQGFNWLFTIFLSFFAIFLLPRQFHVTVVENLDTRHIKPTIWLFPLYLFLFNVFVVFIAWDGLITFDHNYNPDYYSLHLPLQRGDTWLAVLVFMGGFSAVISMIIVSTLALSTMVSNNIIIPYGFIKRMTLDSDTNARNIKNLRRIAIFLIIIISYLFCSQFSKQLSLFSIGLISFLVIAQLAPSFFMGLFWRRGSARGARAGILIGLLVVAYTQFIPIISNVITPEANLLSDGFMGYWWLKPAKLFGISYLSPISNTFFWSIGMNLFVFLLISLAFKGNYRERNYAEMFVNHENYDNLQEGAFIWQGEAYVSDIKRLLVRFLGGIRTERALQLFNRKYNIAPNQEQADARLINFSEKLLTGTLGSASAKILISSVTKEKPISLPQVLRILEENKETKDNNRLLIEKSKELSVMAVQLKNANVELRAQDKQKDDFLDTVAHELKTPIASIKAASEVLQDEKMPKKMRKQFLKNIEADTERLATLIHNILDLEKLSTNRIALDIKSRKINQTIKKAISGIDQIANKKKIKVHFEETHLIKGLYDEDRIIQVLTNLLSNALKFTEEERGIIKVLIEEEEKQIKVAIEDNGKGIPEEDQQYIFEKFYQSKNQNTKKPMGSGFGLAICKQIIESHEGNIWADQQFRNGARLIFTLPKG